MKFGFVKLPFLFLIAPSFLIMSSCNKPESKLGVGVASKEGEESPELETDQTDTSGVEEIEEGPEIMSEELIALDAFSSANLGSKKKYCKP